MLSTAKLFIGVFVLCIIFNYADASAGDRSQFFINCLKGCEYSNCTEDGENFKSHLKQDWFNTLLLWSCQDECIYFCMWRTTNSFVSRQWNVPQFYGKWPFKRLFGIQEPASTLFSMLNLVMHWNMIRTFRREVRSDSPMYYIWHIFCAICMNGWIFSVIFHMRDFPLTELLDYSFAFSMVLASFCCMILRMLHWTSKKVKAIVSLVSLIFFMNHFSYLATGRFDYQYNMKANITIGIATGIGWVIWYMLQRKKKSYAWKILLFQVLVAISLLLEINDFPPLFWVLDAHALWHLSTILPTMLLYRFAIDDTKNLRREKFDAEPLDDKEKLI